MPGKVNEAKWAEAKKAAHKSYPELDEKSDKFWKIVETIYKNEGGKHLSFHERVEKKFDESKRNT